MIHIYLHIITRLDTLCHLYSKIIYEYPEKVGVAVLLVQRLMRVFVSQVKTAGRERRGAPSNRVAQHAAHAGHSCAASVTQPSRARLQRH